MMTISKRSLYSQLPLLLCSTLLFAGCDLIGFGCGGEDRPEYETDYGEGDGVDVGSLIYQTFALFQSSGIPSEIGPEVETGFFDRTAREIKILGSPVFFVEYDSEEQSREVASSISRDGRKVGENKIPERGIMKGTPHFYRTGKIIAVYFGDRPRTLEALSTTLGEQFAGGSVDVEGQVPEFE